MVGRRKRGTGSGRSHRTHRGLDRGRTRCRRPHDRHRAGHRARRAERRGALAVLPRGIRRLRRRDEGITMTDTFTGPAPAEEDRGWSPRLVFSLASIVLVLELLSVSYTMIAMALPSITAEFDTLQGAWLMTAFLLVGAVTAPLTGKLADLFGKRRVVLLCVTAGIAGSVLSATAPGYAMMIAGRAIAGLLL